MTSVAGVGGVDDVGNRPLVSGLAGSSGGQALSVGARPDVGHASVMLAQAVDTPHTARDLVYAAAGLSGGTSSSRGTSTSPGASGGHTRKLQVGVVRSWNLSMPLCVVLPTLRGVAGSASGSTGWQLGGGGWERATSANTRSVWGGSPERVCVRTGARTNSRSPAGGEAGARAGAGGREPVPCECAHACSLGRACPCARARVLPWCDSCPRPYVGGWCVVLGPS